MSATFRTWCAEKRDEAHRLSLLRWAESAAEGGDSLDSALALTTLDHQVRQTIAEQRRSAR